MLKFIEGFEIYGGQLSELTDGVFLDQTNMTFSSSVVRTGTYSIYAGAAQAGELRRALYGENLTLGMAFAFYIDELPVETYTAQLMCFKNDDNTPQVSLWLTTAGNISIGRGSHDVGESYVELARTTTSPVLTDAWQHLEVQIHFDDTAGWYEIRLDGVTVLQGTGVDTINSSVLKNCNQVEGVGVRDVVNGANMNFILYMDDWYCYDMTGSENNDWMGDLRVEALYPVDNGATQEWVANGASAAYDCIDEQPANGDTDYIEATESGLPINSTFEFENVPSYVSAIKGIDVYTKSKKTDAGNCNVQVSMQNGSDETNGLDRAISTIYTHRSDIFELDPSTGALWTKSGLDAALVDIERTA